LGLSYVWTALATVPSLIAAWSLKLITSTVAVLGGLRSAEVRIPTPSFAFSVAAAAAFAAALIAVRRSRILVVTSLVLLLATAMALVLLPPPLQIRPGVLELTAIDVGQAESLFIVTPQGRTLLIDAAGSFGPMRSEFDFGEDVISPYLWSRGIARLDAVVLSHAHSDHMGGMHSILANFRPRELWIGPNASTPALSTLLKEATQAGVRVVPIAGGDQLDFGGAHVDVLWPGRDWELAQKPRNNDSLVMRISYGQTSALLTGDAEKKVERQLSLDQHVQADVLKVAHNGSATSTTPELLAAVRPRFALISVGARNPFGHPRLQVLSRLAERRLTTYRTDTAGAITFHLDGRSVTASTWVLR